MSENELEQLRAENARLRADISECRAARARAYDEGWAHGAQGYTGRFNDDLEVARNAFEAARQTLERQREQYRTERDQYWRERDQAVQALANARQYAEREQKAARKEWDHWREEFNSVAARMRSVISAHGSMLPNTEIALMFVNEIQTVEAQGYDALVGPLAAEAHANPQDDEARIHYAMRDTMQLHRLIGMRECMIQLGEAALAVQSDPASLADSIMLLYEEGLRDPNIHLEPSLFARLYDAWPTSRPPARPGVMQTALEHIQRKGREQLTQEQYAERYSVPVSTMRDYARIHREISALRSKPTP